MSFLNPLLLLKLPVFNFDRDVVEVDYPNLN